MARKIIWSETAAKNKEEIFLYWVYRNKSLFYPRKLDKLIHQTARVLAKNPTIGRKTNVVGVRSKFVRHYQIFYQYSEKLIHILLIWDVRRNPENNPYPNYDLD